MKKKTITLSYSEASYNLLKIRADKEGRTVPSLIRMMVLEGMLKRRRQELAQSMMR